MACSGPSSLHALTSPAHAAVVEGFPIRFAQAYAFGYRAFTIFCNCFLLSADKSPGAASAIFWAFAASARTLLLTSVASEFSAALLFRSWLARQRVGKAVGARWR